MTDSYYFTFMQHQENHNCYVHIKGDYEEARQQMLNAFGTKWAFQYSAEEWFKDGLSQADRFNLKEIKTMNRFIGTKLINAVLMSRQEYNDLRGWTLPSDEIGSDKGYLVEYLDGGPSNHPSYTGYISWSPAEVFEKAYQSTESGMSFGHAIELAKLGNKIARSGWNGKNMFVVYMEPLYLPPYNTTDTMRKVNDRTAKFIGEDKPLNCQPYFAMYNAQEQWIPGWLASQSDMLANDWVVV